MIRIFCRNTWFAYDSYHIVKSFFPDAEIQQKIEPEQESLIQIELDGDSCFFCAEATQSPAKPERRLDCPHSGGDRERTCERPGAEAESARQENGETPCLRFRVLPEDIGEVGDIRAQKRRVNRPLYDWLSELTGETHAWGDMTGVRPTKLLMEQLEEGKSEEEILRFMWDTYRAGEKKVRLGIEIARREKAQLEKLDYRDGYSLYLGIPFCPTTCSYCSFTSFPVARWRDRIGEYVDALLREVELIADTCKDKKLNTIYMGGGTPTTLSPEQMDRILTYLEEHFSFADLKEYTVEAGRPDSITREKLEVLRRHGVSRISINPQTMCQRTLDAVGRRHTVEDVERVFRLAREMGFDNINMDLIAGLPGEHPEDMAVTLERIKALMPDSLTVHALAMKRGSRLNKEKMERRATARKQAAGESEEAAGGCGEPQISNRQMARELEEMIDMAARAAGEMGLLPYYLYRQKNIAGNFENVGYAKVDKAGIYNILIMEEKQSILAAGAGVTTKLLLPYEVPARGNQKGRMTNLVRVENVKDVGEYLSRISEMIERKGEWLWR